MGRSQARSIYSPRYFPSHIFAVLVKHHRLYTQRFSGCLAGYTIKFLLNNLGPRIAVVLRADLADPSFTKDSSIWPHLPTGKTRPLFTGAEVFLDNITSWVSKCEEAHDRCGQNTDISPPSRLIDVGDKGNLSIHLVEIEESLTYEKYVCLSHCWGEIQPLTTTKGNISQHLSNIAWSEIPRTFQQAIEVTRHLNIKYLWIDSLCILQDNLQDWEQTSSHMAEIYGNRFLTISATSAKNSSEGLFSVVPDAYRKKSFARGLASETHHTLTARPAFAHDILGGSDSLISRSENTDFFLQTRAWAYQEHLLSPRVLYFSQFEVAWRCKDRFWCCCSDEDSYVRVSPRYDFVKILDGVGKETTSTAVSEVSNMDDTGRTMDHILGSWRSTIQSYSDKNLTKEGDRLPALSGIAKRFQNIFGGRYLAGIWEQHLVAGLCWHVYLPGKRPEKYTAPSWSWASVFDCKIGYFLQKKLEDPSSIKLHHCVCTPAGLDKTGAVSDGYIRLSGYLMRGTMEQKSSLYQFKFAFLGGPKRIAFPDSLINELDERPPITYYLVPILDDFALVLRKAETYVNTFVRVGSMFHFSHEAALSWDTAEWKEITII